MNMCVCEPKAVTYIISGVFFFFLQNIICFRLFVFSEQNRVL